MLQLHLVKLPGLPCWQQYLLQVSFDSAIDLHGVFATLLTRSNFAMRPGYCMMQEPPQPLQQQRPMHFYSSTGSRHTTATPISRHPHPCPHHTRCFLSAGKPGSAWWEVPSIPSCANCQESCSNSSSCYNYIWSSSLDCVVDSGGCTRSVRKPVCHQFLCSPPDLYCE